MGEGRRCLCLEAEMRAEADAMASEAKRLPALGGGAAQTDRLRGTWRGVRDSGAQRWSGALHGVAQLTRRAWCFADVPEVVQTRVSP